MLAAFETSEAAAAVNGTTEADAKKEVAEGKKKEQHTEQNHNDQDEGPAS